MCLHDVLSPWASHMFFWHMQYKSFQYIQTWAIAYTVVKKQRMPHHGQNGRTLWNSNSIETDVVAWKMFGPEEENNINFFYHKSILWNFSYKFKLQRHSSKHLIALLNSVRIASLHCLIHIINLYTITAQTQAQKLTQYLHYSDVNSTFQIHRCWMLLI